MAKRLPMAISGLTAAIALTAFGYEAVSQKPADADISGPQARPFELFELGKTRTTRQRAPEGGYVPPVTFAPTEEQFNECSVKDLNGDNKTWTYSVDGFTYTYSSAYAADDWCILPAVNIPAGKCKISYSYKVSHPAYKEAFKIYVGNAATVEAMTTLIADKTDLCNGEYVTEEAQIDIPSSGEWYIGLYACSDKDRYKFFVKDISITILDDNQPMPPAIDIAADALDCTVSLTLPTDNLVGEPLQTESLNASIYMDGALMAGGSFTGAPGEVKTFTATVPASGLHTFTASVSYNLNGKNLRSTETSASHYFTKKQPVPTPTGYVFEPDSDEYAWCTVIDSNDDGNKWEYCESGMPTEGAVSQRAFRYSYSYYNAADDWLILPVFDGSTGGAHQVEFNFGTKYNDESMQVCMATEPTVEALSQNVIWDKTLNLDNKFVAQKALFTVEPGVNYYIAFHATSGASKAYIYLQNISVTKINGDAPARPVLSDPTFDGGDGTVTLTMPSVNLDGNALTDEKVFAELTVDGQPFASVPEAAPGESVQVAINGLEMGSHQVSAKAYVPDGQGGNIYSEPASISFKTTIPSSFFYTLPLELGLNSETFSSFLTVNANNDAVEWVPTPEYLELAYNSSLAADDWILTPAVEFSVAKNYEFILTARNSSTSYDEKVEMFIGRTQSVDGMTTEVIPVTKLSSGEFTELASIVSIDEPGRYFVGIHGVSDANKLKLLVKHLSIKESNISPLSPAAVDNLSGDGLETGELTAEVAFQFPVKNISGEDLDINADLTATVTSATESESIIGKPGTQGTLLIACPEGKSEIKVTVSNEYGDSPVAKLKVNCGLDKPKTPVLKALSYSDDNLSATVHFDPVTEGVNGGHVNAGNIDYYLFEWDEDDEDWYQIDVQENVTELTYTVPAGSPQELITLGVQAYNGMNSGSSIAQFSVNLGTPKPLPVKENFAEGKLHHSISVGSTSGYYAPVWQLTKPETVIADAVSTDGEYALYGRTTSWTVADSYLYLPKFSTENVDNPTLQLIYYKHDAGCEIHIMASSHDFEPVEIGSIEVPETTEGWANLTFPLPDGLKNHKWVETYLYVNFPDGSSSVPLIDAYNMLTNDPNAIGEIEADAAGRYVRGVKGAIAVAGYADADVKVCTLAGQTVSDGKGGEGVRYIVVEPGVYVVKAGADSYKVLVK